MTSYPSATARPPARIPRRFRTLAAAVLASTALGGCDALTARMSDAFQPAEIQQMRAAATDPTVKAFYEARQWEPAWTSGEAEDLLEVFQGAQANGLDPSPFTRIIQAAEGRGERDAELTLAALTYAKALAHGAVDPKAVHDIYSLDRPEIDVAVGLDQAIRSKALVSWLNSLAPQDAEYKALSQAYLDYQARAQAAAAAPIPTGPRVTAGAADARIAEVSLRLAQEGFLDEAAAAAATGGAFTPAVSQGLRLFQADQDLKVDGALDDATVEALNTMSADRARQLAVNLERRRWLARDVPATRIDVNTAAAELVYWRDNAPAWKTRTIAGSAENATPALGETFKQLVVNPPWNVPQGIAEKEILPKGQPYLDDNDMYVEDGRVVQRAGPKAALGLVKFDMQNQWAIYLHDTPAKAVFASDERHRSHGCVRVQDAVGFARRLAAEAGKGEEFDTALASGETKVVSLGADIPVRLLYHTTHMNDAGQLVFTHDAYGWDDKLAGVMGLKAARRAGGEPLVSALLGP
jgi:murein L,D-transpeptidase YcbB/YkuD